MPEGFLFALAYFAIGALVISAATHSDVLEIRKEWKSGVLEVPTVIQLGSVCGLYALHTFISSLFFIAL